MRTQRGGPRRHRRSRSTRSPTRASTVAAISPGRGCERCGDRLGRAVVREDDGPLAGSDAVSLDVCRGGSGQHDPGPIVVGEDDRAFRRARGDHDAAGADVPQPALGRRGGMALHRRHVAVVVDAQRRHPGADAIPGRRGIRVDEQDAVLRVGDLRDGGRPAAGLPGPDDQDLAMRVPAVEPAGIPAVTRLESTATGEARHAQAVLQHDRRGAGASAPRPRRPADLDERVRLLRPGRHDPARPVVVDAPPDDVDPVGQQRRGHGVACEAGEGPPVELEGDARRSIDVRAARRGSRALVIGRSR